MNILKVLVVSLCLLFPYGDNVFADVMVGFSKLDITPKDEKVVLGGYGTFFLSKKMTRRSRGTHDPLKVTTVAISQKDSPIIVIAAIDAIGLSPAIYERIKSNVSELIEDDLNLIVTASHTHAAPDLVGLWGPLPKSGRDWDYIDMMEAQVARSIVAAIESLKPATISSSRGSLENKSQSVDLSSIFNTLWFEDENGNTLGTITQWNGHPTMLGGDNRFISAGYPGAFRNYMSKNFSGVHIYLNGLQGDVYPLPVMSVKEDPFGSQGDGIHDPKVNFEDYLKVASVGYNLFTGVKNSMSQKSKIDTVALKHKKISFKTKNKNILFRTALNTGVLEDREGSSRKIRSAIEIVSISDFNYVFVPGEITPEAFDLIEDRLINKLNYSGVFSPVGIANDWLGYMLTDEQYDDDHYKYFKTLAASSSLMSDLIEYLDE